MKKYLISVVLLLFTSSCSANSNVTTLLHCKLSKGDDLLVNYSSNNLTINDDGGVYMSELDEVSYNSTFRFQSEYTEIKIGEIINVFKSFDSLLSESYQYGVIRPSGESEYCDEVFNENFEQAIKLIKRDDSGF